MAVTGTVKGGPSDIFQIVTDPQMHVEIDGSGMLEPSPGPKRLEPAGDTSEIAMDREPLGDIPMGKVHRFPIVPREMMERSVDKLTARMA